MPTLVKKLNQVRHGNVGRRFTLPWKLLRPAWRKTAAVATGGRGFRHIVNGVDEFRLSLELSHNFEPYNWEPEEYREVMATVARGDHFIDVGSFWGLFSLGAAKRVGPTGRVVAIEPGPRQSSILRSNIASNNFESVINCIDSVCADKIGERIDFFIDPEGSMVDSAVPNPERKTIAVSRTTTTIDALVSKFGLSPSVIKIDVEGFEDLVLRGAQQTLEEYKPILFVELHPQQLAVRNVETEDVIGLLEQRGFKCEELSDRAAVRPGHLYKFRKPQL